MNPAPAFTSVAPRATHPASATSALPPLPFSPLAALEVLKTDLTAPSLIPTTPAIVPAELAASDTANALDASRVAKIKDKAAQKGRNAALRAAAKMLSAEIATKVQAAMLANMLEAPQSSTAEVVEALATRAGLLASRLLGEVKKAFEGASSSQMTPAPSHSFAPPNSPDTKSGQIAGCEAGTHETVSCADGDGATISRPLPLPFTPTVTDAHRAGLDEVSCGKVRPPLLFTPVARLDDPPARGAGEKESFSAPLTSSPTVDYPTDQPPFRFAPGPVSSVPSQGALISPDAAIIAGKLMPVLPKTQTDALGSAPLASKLGLKPNSVLRALEHMYSVGVVCRRPKGKGHAYWAKQ
jgi:hypothetical protein